MKALLLAASKETQLSNLAAAHRMLMLPIAGVPVVERMVSLLKRHGITDIAITLHHSPWAIVRHLGYGRRWGVYIHYALEATPLGSAGEAKRLEWYLDESFIVVFGALYTDVDLSSLMAAHRENSASITRALPSAHHPTRSILGEPDNQSRASGILTPSVPHQGSLGHRNGSILVVEPDILSGFPLNQHFDFEHDVVPKMLASGQTIHEYPVNDTLIEISSPENYREAQRRAMVPPAGSAQTDLSSLVIAPTVSNVFQQFGLTLAD